MSQSNETTKKESSSMKETTTNNDRRPPPNASIRHIEKRRTSTCQFADRIAQLSIQHYRKLVTSQNKEDLQQQPESTCLATIVAYDKINDAFIILGMVRTG